jgi:hypothetical protein
MLRSDLVPTPAIESFAGAERVISPHAKLVFSKIDESSLGKTRYALP